MIESVAAFDTEGREIGIFFETTSPFDTPGHMESLLDWHRRAEADGSPHLLLLHAGYAHVPYASLAAVIEQNKEAYYLAFRRTRISWRDGDPDWPAWLHFFLRSLSAQIQRLRSRIEGMNLTLSVLARELAALFENHNILTMKQALEALPGNSRSALKARFAELIEAGLITARGKGRGAYYERN